jgi:uncharacterized protein (TIGR02246 family)
MEEYKMKNTLTLYLNNTRMKFPIPFFLIVLFLTGCASVDITVSTQVGGDKDRAAIQQMLVDWVRAYNAHDAKALAAIYAKDADLSDKMKLLKGREAIQRLWQERFDKNPNVKTKQTSLEVRFLSPTLALETGYWEDANREDGDNAKLKNGMWTCVNQKIGGKWFIISDRGWTQEQSE